MDLTNGSDAELVTAYKNGNRQAVQGLINRHGAALYAFLLRFSHNRAVAEDLSQEVFVKMLKKLPDYDESGKFAGWLLRMANNTAIDHFRDTVRRRERSLDTAAKEGVTLMDTLPSHEDGPEKIIEGKESLAAIRLAFSALSPEQAEVLTLHHFDSLSFKEISARTGLPIGTLLARMSRGRVKMRAQLAGRYKAAHS